MAGNDGRGRPDGVPGDKGREARERGQEVAAEPAAAGPRGRAPDEGRGPSRGTGDPEATAGEATASGATAPDGTDTVVHEAVTPIQGVAYEAIQPDVVTDGAVAARGTSAGEAVDPVPETGTEGTDAGARPADPTVGAVVDRAVDTAGDIAEDPIAFGTKLGEAVVEGADRFATGTTDRVQDGLQSWAERTSEATGIDLPEDMSAAELAESGGETGARIVDRLGAFAEKTADATLDSAQDGADWTADKVGTATDELGAFGEKTLDATWDAAQDGTDWAAETAADAYDAGSDLAGDAAAASEDVFDAAADAAEDLAGAYEDAAASAADATKDAQDAMTDILDNLF